MIDNATGEDLEPLRKARIVKFLTHASSVTTLSANSCRTFRSYHQQKGESGKSCETILSFILSTIYPINTHSSY